MGLDLSRVLRTVAMMAVAGLALAVAVVAASPTVDEVRQAYVRDVDMRWDVPAADADRYARIAQAAFDRAGIELHAAQYVIVVDRNPWVQVALLTWRSADGQWRIVGASPVSTGREDTATPTGVFAHGTMDFRSDGAPDKEGILRYGRKGLRVFDFGMRLRMHATDPDLLERRLGTAQSDGAIRIPSALDALLDHFGVVDAEQSSVPSDDRVTVADPGRFLVVVDSGRTDRPDWAPAPYIPRVRQH